MNATVRVFIYVSSWVHWPNLCFNAYKCPWCD